MEVQENKKIIYIAGKINGDDNYKKKFDKTQKYLEDRGFIVLNPASLPEGMQYEQYIDIGYAMIRQSHKIYFLADWKESPGAKREHAYARAYNKDLMFQ